MQCPMLLMIKPCTATIQVMGYKYLKTFAASGSPRIDVLVIIGHSYIPEVFPFSM